MDTKQAMERWNCDIRAVREWCREGVIDGAAKSKRGSWIIPDDAKRPLDRSLSREILWSIVEWQNGCVSRIDLTGWGVSRTEVLAYLKALERDNCLELEEDDTAGSSSLRITKRGFSLIGRGGKTEPIIPSAARIVTTLSGKFVGALLDEMFM